MYRILLVEDDAALARAISQQLESYGYETSCVSDFHNVVGEFLNSAPQLVLMDIHLPFRNGYDWCREIRSCSSVPIVFLSSASDNLNIVMAINMGGDDFIAKPVEPMVLCAKVGAILRRTYELAGDSQFLEFHGAMLNLSDGTVSFQGTTIDLTKNEFRILQALLEQKGKVVSREALMLKLWQNDCFVEENT
ncbi:MAG: response regulator transcription factor, partial [Oscillospiraceae bacterium]|nr:response regulator transcription factor [Oscillospiraceae bacterium]